MESIDVTIIDTDDRESAVPAFRVESRILVQAPSLPDALGWTLKPEGLCRGEVCVPVRTASDLTELTADGTTVVDLEALGRVLRQPVVVDADNAIAAFGVAAGDRASQLATLDAPDFSVDDLDGRSVSLTDFGEQKKMIVAFASWCGCRYDLPAWQAMHAELAPLGFTIIGVAMDEQADDVREWVDQVEFPVLLDRDHVIADAYDIRNVPTVVWIDEHDRIVRPNDQAFGDDEFIAFHGVDSDPHHQALRQWVTTGELPMDEDEVRARIGGPDENEQLARVHWRVAIALHRDGRDDAARAHFDRAGELAPHDFTIRRSSLPLRGIDPFLSNEFFALYESYQNAGQPGWAFDHPPPPK